MAEVKAVLVRDPEGCKMTGLGRTKFRQIAEEAGGVIKVGKVRLNDINKILDYIMKEYSL